VVDSTEIDRLDDAAFELRYLLNFEGKRDLRLREAPLLVLANKQDLEGAKTPEEITTALKLEDFRDREWKTIACSAVDGSGIAEGMDWLVVSDSRPLQTSSMDPSPED
jgi:signal recognition particle receptor subunit beta